MLKKDFLLMMKQDLETSDKQNLKDLLMCFEELLKDYPDSIEIDSSKSVADCYKKMEEYAKKNAVGHMFAFSPTTLKEFILEYLNLKDVKSAELVKLEDFI